jgi:hypothetical protein
MTEHEKSLEDFESTQGLNYPPAQGSTNEVHRFLGMEPSALGRLSRQELALGAAVLSQYAIHLQKSFNKEKARQTTAQHLLDKLIGLEATRQRGASKEERRALAIRASPDAQALEDVRVHAQARLERLDNQSYRVSELARRLEQLQLAKRKFADD